MPATKTNASTSRSFALTLPGGRRLALESGRPRLLGVVNVTPDSFSDGGRFLAPERAVEHALRLLREGADLIDLGAESTRPGGIYGAGAAVVSIQEEIDRLLPVVEGLRTATAAPLSIDTRKPEVAAAALAAGADLINDVSGLRDPAMRAVVARTGCPAIVMHSRGEPATMQREASYGDVVTEVRDELSAAMALAVAAGISRSQLLVDPGLGFAKEASHSLCLLAALDRLAELDAPIVLGASRKSFLGAITAAALPDRLAGSLAAALWAGLLGAALLRVHDVAETHQACAVWRALADYREPAS